MWREVIGLTGGGATGLMTGFLAGNYFSGPIGGSMFAIGGALGGAYVGWLVALCWPLGRHDLNEVDNYSDQPPVPPPG